MLGQFGFFGIFESIYWDFWVFWEKFPDFWVKFGKNVQNFDIFGLDLGLLGLVWVGISWDLGDPTQNPRFFGYKCMHPILYPNPEIFRWNCMVQLN
jgi:hypothetical protein